MIVTKNNITRDIKQSQVEEYLAAGWKQPGAKVLDVTVKGSKQTAQATAAVIEATGDANTDNQGD